MKRNTAIENLARRTLALLALTIVLAPALASPQTTHATLDASFGTGGRVITNIEGNFDFARGVVVQPGGKIIAAGVALGDRGSDFGLTRYNSDGSLDASFGANGIVTTDFGGSFEGAWSVAIRADGKIVAAGLTSISGVTKFALARYNIDGRLDASFGTGGRVTTGFPGASVANGFCVALQPDGKVVVAGWTNFDGGADFALARYDSAGTLDASFGTGGRVITAFADSQGLAGVFSIALQPDGKIVAAGGAKLDGKYDFTLARYNSNGTLDAGFGTGGRVVTDFGGSDDGAEAVALQQDGKIVAAGFARGVDFALARYNGDGTLDTSFGTGGRVITDFAGFSDTAYAVAVQPDGKIVASGSAGIINTGFDFALARYNRDGTLDASFGKVTTDFAAGTDQAFAVAVQADGKIVAAGQSDGRRALARYEARSAPTIAVTLTTPTGHDARRRRDDVRLFTEFVKTRRIS